MQALDEIARDEIHHVCFTTLQHGDARGPLWHGNHHELLHVHRSVIVLERFELQLGARLLVHQLVGPCPDGFLLEAIRANLLIILRRHNPAGTAHIRRPKDHGEVQKGLFEVKTHGAGIDNLYALCLRLQHISLGASVAFKAELHVLDRDRLTVVKLDPRPEPEGGALRVRGKFVTLGQARVIKQRLTVVLDQGIVEGIQEVVGRRCPVMLLRVEPLGRHIRMPGQDDLPFGHHLGSLCPHLRIARQEQDKHHPQQPNCSSHSASLLMVYSQKN